MKYQHVISALTARPWAIERAKGDVILQVVAARAHGISATKEEIQAAVGAQRLPVGPRVEDGAIAVIPVFGTIMHRATMMTEFSGGATVQDTRRQLRQALMDPAVRGILFEFDSPGGHIDGVTEFAAELRQARGKKPMAAIANTMSASAAYWWMSQIPDIAVAPSGAVGSVGVYMAHADWSAWDEKEGVKVTYITYGDHKAEGHPHAPLSQDTLDHWQSQVNALGEVFVADVAAGRKVSTEAVLEQFGQGRMLMPDEAVSVKMVDYVATFDEMVDRLLSKTKKGSRIGPAASASEAEALALQAEMESL